MSIHQRGIGDNGGPPLELYLTDPQFELVSSTKRYPAMVAGFGAGKTQALIKRVLTKKFEYPKQNVAYYLPTYDLVTTIAIPRISEALAEFGLYEGKHYKVNKSDKYFEFNNGGGRIYMRTMDNPGRIVGYEVAHSCVDELDTLKMVDAELVWQKVIARNRQKMTRLVNNEWVPCDDENSIAVGTTPEGFRFVYEKWKKNPPDDQYQLIKASTYSNARNLPKNYIDDLKALYPPQLIEAYLNGEFVNLTSGSIYPNFDREKNFSAETIRNATLLGTHYAEPLHIGLDFNVTKMAAVVHVYRDGNPHAVAELIDLFDTPAFISAVKDRWQSKGHQIFVYPDASGNSRKSQNASETDISLLEAAGFTVCVNPTNPLVRDRILSMNVVLANRRYRINVAACPSYAAALEQQIYDKNGEPDKTSGKDHVNDAGGYFIANRFPVIRPTSAGTELGGY